MVIAGRVIQGAAGATILACGLSLLSVANDGRRAAAGGVAVGRRRRRRRGGRTAAGWRAGRRHRLAGAVLDRRRRRGASACCSPRPTVTESRDPNRPRSIDYAGTVLIALTLAPLILGVSKGGDWGWASLATLACFAVIGRRRVRLRRGRAAGRRPAARPRAAAQPGPGRLDDRHPHRRRHDQRADVPAQPLLPGPGRPGLQPARRRVWRRCRRPSGWSSSPRSCRAWRRGSAAARSIGAGFALTTVGFAVVGFVDASWAYAAFLLPLVAIAVGMGLSNGPASSAATACVPENQVGGGLRRLQHGALRRRRGRHRAGRDDLRHRDRRPARRRRSRRPTRWPPAWPPPRG